MTIIHITRTNFLNLFQLKIAHFSHPKTVNLADNIKSRG